MRQLYLIIQSYKEVNEMDPFTYTKFSPYLPHPNTRGAFRASGKRKSFHFLSQGAVYILRSHYRGGQVYLFHLLKERGGEGV